jgi:hypothetical protein
MNTFYITDKDGKIYPIKISQGVLEQLAIAEGVSVKHYHSFFQSWSDWSIERLYKLFYTAMRIAARREKIEFVETFQDFMDWLADDESISPQLMKLLTESSPVSDEKKTPKQGNKRK